jgi:D-sedoheptulose 7-phosphate isomerase
MSFQGEYQNILEEYAPAAPIFQQMLERFPELKQCAPDLAQAFQILMETFRRDGALFICGNGGSMADALHIAGELDKSFRHPRGLTEEQRGRLLNQPDGAALAEHLQRGLRTIPLGANPALSSAIANDNPLRDIAYAQELFSLGRSGDVLLGISTSGKAQNVRYAASVAHSLGMKVISLTGPNRSPLVEQADVAICAPGRDTPEIQGWHIQLYHGLCDMLEAASFGPSSTHGSH